MIIFKGEKLLLWWIIVCTGVTAGPLSAQNPGFDPQWRYYGPEHGLGMSFNVVKQDHQGFVWLGSTNGLYRFDGYGFTAYKRHYAPPFELSDNWIWDIREDATGNMWFGTYSGGLAKWERRTGRFTFYQYGPEETADLEVLYILIDSTGMVWCITRDKESKTHLDKLNPATGKFQHYLRQPVTRQSSRKDQQVFLGILHDHLSPLQQDAHGTIWVGTETGLYYYNPEKDGFDAIPALKGFKIVNLYPSPANVNHLFVAATDTSTPAKGYLFRLNLQSLVADNIPLTQGAHEVPLSIVQYKEHPNGLWVSGNTGLWEIDLKNKLKTRFYPLPKAMIREAPHLAAPMLAMVPDASGWLWLHWLNGDRQIETRGADDLYIRAGILYFDTKTKSFTQQVKNPLYLQNEIDPVRSYYCDPQQNIWVGTENGFFLMNKTRKDALRKPLFSNYPLDVAMRQVRDYCEQDSDTWWLATGGGLCRLTRSTGKIQVFNAGTGEPGRLRNNMLQTLYKDEGEEWLWIGHEKGIDRMSLRNPGYFLPLEDEEKMLNTRVNDILPAGNGMLWIGTAYQGLLLFDPASNRVVSQYKNENRPGDLPSNLVNNLFRDSQGRLWIAAGMEGFCEAIGEPIQLKFTKPFFPGLFFLDFQEDQTGDLWIASANYGMVRFNPQNSTSELFTSQNGLLRNSVTGIEMDREGRLWFASLGLGLYDPRKKTFAFFRASEGITALDPAYSFFKSSDGAMCYSGRGGPLQVFYPNTVKDYPRPPAVVINDFKLFDESLAYGKPGILNEQISVAGSIRLRHHQHTFSFAFTGIEFSDPGNQRYAYRLANLDKDWVDAGARREVRYTRVPPGHYRFEVKAVGTDGHWSERPASVEVIVLPPWWTTWWAYLLYAGLAGGTLFWAFATQKKRLQLRTARRLEQEEAQRIRELDALKSKLYTNITHEFRTPLTVILGLSEALQEQLAAASPGVLQSLESVSRNGENLLRLINQMLDLAQLESGAMALQMKQGNVVGWLRYLTQSFESLAQTKRLTLHFEAHPKEFIMDFDADKLQKIVSNLLSNAIKFTPKGGRIQIQININADVFRLTISDTGPGIAPEALPRIFDRFYSLAPAHSNKHAVGSDWQTGTGIGLALVKELIQLMHGRITVESPEGNGAQFSLTLPVTQESTQHFDTENWADNPLYRSQPESIPIHNNKQNTELPLALIVEDNADVAGYIATCLQQEYRIEFAADGQTGIDLALEHTPDIIVSDVMMPGVDGFELCERLKTDRRSNHIPIILLTARATLEDRIAGLRRGADDYLAKPFSKEELLARMQGLINTRKALWEHYANGKVAPAAIVAPEDEFILQFREIVLANFGEDNLSVELLAQQLFMSRSQVFRKLKALTGKDPTHFIRHIRLEKAKSLLSDNSMTIAAIADTVGFSDQGYFTKVFKETFGQSPSFYRKKINKEEA